MCISTSLLRVFCLLVSSFRDDGTIIVLVPFLEGFLRAILCALLFGLNFSALRCCLCCCSLFEGFSLNTHFCWAVITASNMALCMCGHTYTKSMDQPGKVASPACGQLNRKNECFPVRVCASEFGLARQVRQSRPASARSSPYSG